MAPDRAGRGLIQLITARRRAGGGIVGRLSPEFENTCERKLPAALHIPNLFSLLGFVISKHAACREPENAFENQTLERSVDTGLARAAFW